MTSRPEDDLGLRGSGRTTSQIKRAPRGALIITHTRGHIHYARHIARSIGRHDVQFVSLDTAKERGWQRTRGLFGTDAVILDHACWQFMTRAEKDRFIELQNAYRW